MPGLLDYKLYCIAFSGQLTVALAWRYGSAFRGIGGWLNSGGSQSITAVSATVSGETLTMVGAGNMLHYASGNHSVKTDLAIVEIIGIV